MVDFIIYEKWFSEKKTNVADEAERVVLAAAKIISAEIREKKKIIRVNGRNRRNRILD